MSQSVVLARPLETPRDTPIFAALERPSTVETVRAILSLPDEQLDYARAKLAFDGLVEPSLDADTTLSELNQMSDAARQLAGSSADAAAKLVALRTLIYTSGPWNDYRPFGYDHSDPQGCRLGNKLLANYLSTRLGNCISMPILFLILGERLGLDVALATAPLHMFVRHHREDGRVINLETTSGAHPARDEWLRQHFPMSDLAIANGLYLRSLPRREAVAHMATTIVEHLLADGRHADAIGVCAAILSHSPRDVFTMVKQGTAYGALLEGEFSKKYPAPYLIPPPLQARHLMLRHRNRALFEAAEGLGWVPSE